MYRLKRTSGLYGNRLFWWRFPIELFKDSKHSAAFLNCSMLWCFMSYSLSSLKFLICNKILPFLSAEEGAPSATNWITSPKSFLLLQDDWFKSSPDNGNSTNNFHELHIKCMHLPTNMQKRKCKYQISNSNKSQGKCYNHNSQLN